MTRTMRAYRIEQWQVPARLVEVPVPEPGPGQVRVRVGGCGLCHSDLAMGQLDASLGAAIGWRVPFTLGHETAGWIDALGPGAGGCAEGDPVALVSPSSCGICRWCQRGQENACPNGLVGRGYGVDGGLAEYVLVGDPDRTLLPMAKLDPRVAGPLVDAGATSHHAVQRVLPHLDGDSTAVVIGVGGLGGFVVQLLRALSGARVVAVDSSKPRRDAARAYGANEVMDGVDDNSRSRFKAIVGSDPVDAVVDLVGSDSTIAFATSILASGGALALVGAAGGALQRPWYGTLPRDGEVFTFQGSDLADARAVIALADEGRIVTEVELFSLDRVREAYVALEQGTLRGRAVVQP